MLTGSIWDIIRNLAWQIDVPDEHVASGRTTTTFSSSREGYQAPMHVRFAKSHPDNAYVSVQAHDHWFYIDQDDRQSKRAFSFLELLLTLAESQVPGQAPLITISN